MKVKDFLTKGKILYQWWILINLHIFHLWKFKICIVNSRPRNLWTIWFWVELVKELILVLGNSCPPCLLPNLETLWPKDPYSYPCRRSRPKLETQCSLVDSSSCIDSLTWRAVPKNLVKFKQMCDYYLSAIVIREKIFIQQVSELLLLSSIEHSNY